MAIEISKDDETRAYYESELIFELDQRGRINQAVREERIEMAKKMIKRGIPLEYVVEDTGLTIEQIDV